MVLRVSVHRAMQDQDTLVARKKRKSSNRTQTRAIAGASLEVSRIALACTLGAGCHRARADVCHPTRPVTGDG